VATRGLFMLSAGRRYRPPRVWGPGPERRRPMAYHHVPRGPVRASQRRSAAAAQALMSQGHRPPGSRVTRAGLAGWDARHGRSPCGVPHPRAATRAARRHGGTGRQPEPRGPGWPGRRAGPRPQAAGVGRRGPATVPGIQGGYARPGPATGAGGQREATRPIAHRRWPRQADHLAPRPTGPAQAQGRPVGSLGRHTDHGDTASDQQGWHRRRPRNWGRSRPKRAIP